MRPKVRAALLWAGLVWMACLAGLSYKLWSVVLSSTNWALWSGVFFEALASVPALIFKQPGILWGVAVVAGAAGAGRSLLVRIFPEHPPLSLCAAAGCALIALLCIVLGSLGLYTPPLVVVLVCGCIALGAVDFFINRGEGGGFRLSRAEAAGLAIAGLVVFVTALNPTLFYDALHYHLSLPKHYLMTGSTAPVYWHSFSHFPSNYELLLGAGLAGGGVLPSQVLAAGIWLFCVLAIRDAAARFVSVRAGGFSLLVSLCTLSFATSSLLLTADPLVLLFSTGGLYCLLGAFESSRSGDLSSLARWSICWGLFAGGAAGVKYSAWMAVPLLQGIILLAFSIKLGGRGVIRAGAGLFLALLALSPWLIRNLVFSGNPVMPVPVDAIFKGLSVQAWEALKSDAHGVRWTSPGTLLSVLFSPWRMVWSDWNGLAREFGAARFLGPLIWMGAPLIPAAGERKRAATIIALYGLAALFLSLSQFRMIRFAYPGIGALAMAAGAGLDGFFDGGRSPRAARYCGYAVLAASSIICAALFLRTSANYTAGFRYPRTGGDLEAYISQRAELDPFMAATVPLQLAANRKLPDGARILFVGETRFFYIDRPATAPSFIDPNPLLELLRRSPAEAAARTLLDSGITHVLICPSELDRIAHYGALRLTPPVRQKVLNFTGSDWCEPVLTDESGRVCRLSDPDTKKEKAR